MGDVAASLEALDESGTGVRAEFYKSGDRFEHSIYRFRNGESSLWLRSVEAGSDPMAPLSPPYAEVHQQGDMVFLSGATSLTYYSMSVEAKDGKLSFEVACRVKGQPEFLGSTYREHAERNTLEVLNATLARAADSLTIIPTERTFTEFPATVQWAYSVA